MPPMYPAAFDLDGLAGANAWFAEDCDVSVLSGPASTLRGVTEGTLPAGKWSDSQWYVIFPVACLPAVEAGPLDRSYVGVSATNDP